MCPMPPRHLRVDHTCHNPPCVNPEHLRLVTNKQNAENLEGAHRGNKSGVRGVSWDKRTRSWQASVGHNYKSYFVGRFADLQEAAEAVRLKRNELHSHNDKDRV